MTVYCGSSTGRSRPTTFMYVMAGGDVQHIPEPLAPNESVETLDDDLNQLDEPLTIDPGLPLTHPSRKGIQEQDNP